MGRGRVFGLPGVAAFTLASIGVTWSVFNSTIYPYTISQPSSFRHVVLRDSSDQPVDYFFPSPLGSTTTNLHIQADPERGSVNEMAHLRGAGGRNVHLIGWMQLAGERVPLVHGDFKGLAGRWTIEEVAFSARGMVWYITASYDLKYRSLRPILLRMMRSFRLR